MSRWAFGVTVSIFTAGGALLTFGFVNDPDRSLTARGLMTAGGALAGTVAGVIVWCLWFVVATPYRQRDDARQEMARLQEARADKGFLDYLGRQLTMGNWHFDSIARAAEDWNETLAQLKGGQITQEEALKITETTPGFVDKVHKWRTSIFHSLNERLGWHYAARFDSDAGLSPSKPPTPGVAESVWASDWRSLDFRLQRLHQIIEELSRDLRK